MGIFYHIEGFGNKLLTVKFFFSQPLVTQYIYLQDSVPTELLFIRSIHKIRLFQENLLIPIKQNKKLIKSSQAIQSNLLNQTQ